MRDVKLDIDNDLYATSNGDFGDEESDLQHIADIIELCKGELKEYPILGVGIVKYLNSGVTQQEIQREVRLQLESDGWNGMEIENILTRISMITNVGV